MKRLYGAALLALLVSTSMAQSTITFTNHTIRFPNRDGALVEVDVSSISTNQRSGTITYIIPCAGDGLAVNWDNLKTVDKLRMSQTATSIVFVVSIPMSELERRAEDLRLAAAAQERKARESAEAANKEDRSRVQRPRKLQDVAPARERPLAFKLLSNPVELYGQTITAEAEFIERSSLLVGVSDSGGRQMDLPRFEVWEHGERLICNFRPDVYFWDDASGALVRMEEAVNSLGRGMMVRLTGMVLSRGPTEKEAHFWVREIKRL